MRNARVAGAGVGDGRCCREQRSHVAHGEADRVGGRGRWIGARRVHQRPVVRIALGLLDDPAHDLHRLQREAPARRFGRQHHRVGAVVDGGGDVGRLGARRHRRVDHRLEHLRGDDHWLAGATACRDQALLHGRHLLGRHLHAEVAARHHHRVGRGDDGIERDDRRRLLHLGDDARTITDQRAHLDDVLGPLHERQRNPVDAELQAELEIRAVLVGQRRQRQHEVRHVDALAIRQCAAVDHHRVRELRAARLDAQPHAAVVQQQFRARDQRGEDFRVRQCDARGVAR